MEIKFEITKNDLVSFLKYHSNESGSYKLIRWIIYLFLLFVLINSAVIINSYFLDESTISFIVLILLALILWYLILKYRDKLLFKNDKRFLKMANKPKFSNAIGNKNLDFTDEGILRIDENGENFKSWKEISKIVKMDEYVFLYTIIRTIYIIPLRIFESDEEKNDFVDKIEYYLNNQKSKE